MWQTSQYRYSSTLKSPRCSTSSEVTVAKNVLGRWECPISESRGNWQTPRWPLAKWPSKKEGCRKMNIPLSRYMEHKKAPCIHQVMEDAIDGRLDVEKTEGVYNTESTGEQKRVKELGISPSSETRSNKIEMPRNPLDPREIDTVPFPRRREEGVSREQLFDVFSRVIETYTEKAQDSAAN
ncbi:hypothetical protein NEOLEDRAFT_1178842 [Neolentinus lepideus HHB14362 ss-1]|uniref:Uncharacterized protein n=1 Tax=Neolentinus lepideus HHB14362 ss-1 TaxID=1314782 RepID=A0A165SFY9_9AGAM|nr:hypothetical protein NEOLEDRAFT_1178842 [Neolentinus lepideus HHB14362 ss-1]